MSALKIQLKELLQKLSHEANKIQDPEIKKRYYFLKRVAESKKSILRACESCGKSRDYFYDLVKKLFAGKSIESLKPDSKRPHQSPNQTPKRVERRIRKLRLEEPSHGPERISFYLKKKFNMICAPSTVAAVLGRLKLVSSKCRDKLTKKHLKRYRRPLPGYLQMDVKYVPYKMHGHQYYQFNVVDHCTTWRLSRIYERIDHETTRSFLRELDELCPFPIFEIQTDNGQEFTDKYRHGNLEPSGNHVLDIWCMARDIRHRLIPIGQKELNGKVENTHKQDDREFYAKYSFQSLHDLQKGMRHYCWKWNELRHTKALGWLTPTEAIERSWIRVIAWLGYLKEKWLSPQAPLLSESPKEEIQPRKLTPVDRYLQFIEWEEKQGYRLAFPLSAISQNFSWLFQIKFMLQTFSQRLKFFELWHQ